MIRWLRRLLFPLSKEEKKLMAMLNELSKFPSALPMYARDTIIDGAITNAQIGRFTNKKTEAKVNEK